MGDSAEFEKLTGLEARLASALDRIAAGLARGADLAGVSGDPTFSSAALEDAQARAVAAETARAESEAELAELTERVGALETRLAEAQEALGQAEAGAAGGDAEETAARANAALQVAYDALVAERDDLARRLQEAQANSQAASTVASESSEDLARLKAELAEALSARDALAEDLRAREAGGPAATPDRGAEASGTAELETRVAILERRAERLKAERDQARDERDEARDLADELSATADGAPDDRLLALRSELRRMRAAADGLAAELDALRAASEIEPGQWDTTLTAELDALRAARATDAAEIGRIIADLKAGMNGEAGNA